jgi:magnesium transporter
VRLGGVFAAKSSLAGSAGMTTPPQPRPAPGDTETGGPAAPSVSTATPPLCPSRTRLYREGDLLEEGFPPEQISERLAAAPDTVVWLDLLDPDMADLQIVTEEFGLHPLAVEDAVHDHQRPKLDRYRTHLFANVYAAHVEDTAAGATELTTSEISVFITPRALITVRKSDFDVDALIQRWDLDTELAREAGVSFLLYGLLDAIADGHYAAVEQLDEAADTLEDQLFLTRPEVDIRRRGFELRRTLADLRRIAAPMHELVGRLMRTDTHLATGALTPYYQDVYDHVLRTGENIDNARDLVTSILDANLTEQSNELNEITKKLASWAAIIAVPTAITGYYGQNVPYPGFGHHSGFVISTLAIIILAGGLYLLLRRQRWL